MILRYINNVLTEFVFIEAYPIVARGLDVIIYKILINLIWIIRQFLCPIRLLLSGIMLRIN